MIKIICNVCKKDARDGYSTIKTWGTYPNTGYLEETIHVCHGCNKEIQGFIGNLTKEGSSEDKKDGGFYETVE